MTGGQCGNDRFLKRLEKLFGRRLRALLIVVSAILIVALGLYQKLSATIEKKAETETT
ncbi:MAG: hypothetical protein NUV86_05200 [Candidatus Scalindua sp.]|nr:hypothetical protein [Candidatus Scalindua sp.]MCR4345405.1 hypothetical protein [Candidatus Scalindua sp.]